MSSRLLSALVLGSLIAPSAIAAPMITEFMASNSSTLTDGNGDSPDWIEIHNPDATSISLSGFTLSDDPAAPSKWTFPAVDLLAGEFLVVFASGNGVPDPGGNLHTNFKLSAGGDYLSFRDPSGTLLSEFNPGGTNFPALTSDVSYGLAFFTPPPPPLSTVLIGNDFENGNATTGNGSFEDTNPSSNPSGSGGSTRWAANGAGQAASVDGWTATWNSGFIGFDDGSPASDGVNYAFVNSNSSGTFNSSGIPVVLQAGDEMVLEMDVTTNQAGGQFLLNVSLLFLDGTDRNFPSRSITSPSAGTYTTESFTHIANDFQEGNNAVAVRFQIVNPNGNDQPRVDNIRLVNSRPDQNEIISTGDPARFRVPSNSAVDNIWFNPNFNDNSWSTGSTPFGYENSSGSSTSYAGIIDTSVPSGTTSLYLRQDFFLADRTTVSDLLLELQYDDGFIVYLNGERVEEQAAPASATFQSTASSDHPDPSAIEFTEVSLKPHLDFLVDGENVLAIHALNAGSNSSDFLITPRLTAFFTNESSPSLRDPAIIGILQEPTPGEANSEVQASPVSFSMNGGTFTSNFSLTLTSEFPGEDIRYTLDGSSPTNASPLYTSPLTISGSTTVRARSFSSVGGIGKITGQSFVKIASGASSFTSNLPVLVIDNNGQGNPVDRLYRTCSYTLFEPDPTSGQTSLTGTPTFSERGAWHRRGSSSFQYDKANYRVEFRDENDEDKEIAPLGMPRNSDWILSTTFRFDRALMRNAFASDISNQMGIYAPRYRYVEVFFNQDGDDLEESDYYGVYLLFENIKRDNDRVDVEKLEPTDTDPAAISGGYIFKIDRGSSSERWRTSRSLPSNSGSYLVHVEPDASELNTTQRDFLRGYVQDFEDALFGSNFTHPTTGLKYSDYIDVDSFIDHHLFRTFGKEPDAMRFSTFFHKKRDGKIKAGPIWDQERAIGVETDTSTNRARDPESWSAENVSSGLFDTDWWDRLFEDPDFMQLYLDRFAVVLQEEYSTTNLNTMIDGYFAKLTDLNGPAVRNASFWGANQTGGGGNKYPNPRILASTSPFSNDFYHFADPAITSGFTDPDISPTAANIFAHWQSEVDHLRNWVIMRRNWLDQQLPPRADFTVASGTVQNGATVNLIAPAGFSGSGSIYYTLDGTDPRAPGGGPSTSALLWDGSPLSLSQTQQITARVLDPTIANPKSSATYDVWSARSTNLYEVGPSLSETLVISELNYNPLPASTPAELAIADIDNGDFEFIELINTHPTETVNLIGASFSAGVELTFGNVTLAPGERGVIVRRPAAFEARYGSGIRILGTFTEGLSKGGEEVTLLDGFGNIIQSFTYDDTAPWPTAPDGSGASLVLVNPFNRPPHDEAASWRASLTTGGTPGTSGGTPFPGGDIIAFALPGGFKADFDSDHRPTLTIGLNPLAEDIQGIIQVSTDLQNWSTGDALFERISQSPNGTVSYRMKIIPTTPKWFVRYKIEPR